MESIKAAYGRGKAPMAVIAVVVHLEYINLLLAWIGVGQ